MTAVGRQWSFLQGFVFTESRLKCVQSPGNTLESSLTPGISPLEADTLLQGLLYHQQSCPRFLTYPYLFLLLEHLWYFALCVSP